MRPQLESDDALQKDGHFQNYADYSRTLRAWLVAYGIGGPVLFLTNTILADRVASSGYAAQIVSAFMLGVALQILLALVNKWGAWHMYRGAGDLPYQKSRWYRTWGWINSKSEIDLAVDLISLVAFVVATWGVLNVFMLAKHAA